MSEQEAWAQELEQERYRAACEAIDRCAKAGARMEDLKLLARECGVDIKHTTIGEANAAHK